MEAAAAPAGFAVSIVGLGKSYRSAAWLRKRAVLSGVDLRLARGGSLGLVGPNGSGKSTLLCVLAGVEAADEGEVRVLGGGPSDASVRRRVGYLPEDSPFPRELSALAVLDLLASLHRLERRAARERGEALLAQVGLAHAARTRLGRYSRGMLRRFGIAQALLHQPELLLLDEPTAGLDAEGHGALDKLLRAERARGTSLIVCSHVLADAHRHCDQLAVLIGGRIAAHGAPREVLAEAGGGVELELEALAPEALRKVESAIDSAGGRRLATRPSQASLLALYRRFTEGQGRQ
jgi:ABC-2 type transport system ATP-binding protein